jgi:hypothetical protein
LPQWYDSWLLSLLLVLTTVILHVLGLGTIREKGVTLLERMAERRSFTVVFALVMGATVLLVTMLHAVEAAAWAVMYLWLIGALPDARSAMLYSLSAMTTYGHAALYLEPHWQMMGAIEALNGVVLFGVTTATLFGVIESVSRIGSTRIRR